MVSVGVGEIATELRHTVEFISTILRCHSHRRPRFSLRRQASPSCLAENGSPRTFADRSARSYWWRGVECHFWPGDLAADQQRYEQRCSKQATSDHSEKTNVGFVLRHFPLLHDNYAGMKRFRVVGQVDCGSLPHWKTGGPARIFGGWIKFCPQS
jgi:hypothetical protein